MRPGGIGQLVSGLAAPMAGWRLKLCAHVFNDCTFQLLQDVEGVVRAKGPGLPRPVL